MQPQARAGRGSLTHTERLKKACNECSTSKVKCSGEREGCQRCIDLNLQCVFELSRVGKVPGIRARKQNNDAHGSFTTLPPRQRMNAQAARAHNSMLRSVEESSVAVTPFDLFSTDDPTQSFLTDEDIYAITEASTRNQQIFDRNAMSIDDNASAIASDPSSVNFDPEPFQVSTMGYHSTAMQDISSDSQHPPGSGRVLGTSVQSSVTSASVDGEPPSKAQYQSTVIAKQEIECANNSKCVLACTAVINKVEAFIEGQVRIIPVAIETVKRSTTMLDSIVRRAPMSERCHLLLVVGINQLILVIERNCLSQLESTEENTSRPQPLTADSERPEASSLADFEGFEGFEPDPAEQRAWHARALFKALTQIQVVFQKVRALAAQRTASSQALPSARNEESVRGSASSVEADELPPSQSQSSNAGVAMPASASADNPCIAQISTHLADVKARAYRISNLV